MNFLLDLMNRHSANYAVWIGVLFFSKDSCLASPVLDTYSNAHSTSEFIVIDGDVMCKSLQEQPVEITSEQLKYISNDLVPKQLEIVLKYPRNNVLRTRLTDDLKRIDMSLLRISNLKNEMKRCSTKPLDEEDPRAAKVLKHLLSRSLIDTAKQILHDIADIGTWSEDSNVKRALDSNSEFHGLDTLKADAAGILIEPKFSSSEQINIANYVKYRNDAKSKLISKWNETASYTPERSPLTNGPSVILELEPGGTCVNAKVERASMEDLLDDLAISLATEINYGSFPNTYSHSSMHVMVSLPVPCKKTDFVKRSKEEIKELTDEKREMQTRDTEQKHRVWGVKHPWEYTKPYGSYP